MKGEVMKCGWCGKEIVTPVFIRVKGDVMIPTDLIGQKIYRFPEQAENYAKQIPMHPPCWIELLRHCGVDVIDMKEVEKKYLDKNKEVGDGLGSDNTSG